MRSSRVGTAPRAEPDDDDRSALARAEWLSRRLDTPMGVLGIVFLLVVLGQVLATDRATVTGFAVAGWVLWSVFVAEFVLRAVVARNRGRFWARNWWQLVFLVVPFLRFARVLPLLRVARVGSVLSAALRGSRSAGRLLSGRIGWLLAVTAVVVLASSQLLYVLGAYGSYGEALHDAALATITGEPLAAPGVPARFLEVLLAVYSVAVFATLAGALGAFFLSPGRAGAPGSGPPGPVASGLVGGVGGEHLAGGAIPVEEPRPEGRGEVDADVHDAGGQPAEQVGGRHAVRRREHLRDTAAAQQGRPEAQRPSPVQGGVDLQHPRGGGCEQAGAHQGLQRLGEAQPPRVGDDVAEAERGRGDQ